MMTHNGHDQAESGDASIDDQSSAAPEWGKAGRVAVLTMWTRDFVRLGLIKGLGLMLPTLQYQFVTKTFVIGWIVSLVLAMDGLISPFAILLGKRFGSGLVVTVSAAMIGLSFIAASLATSALQLAIILMFLAGSGLGVSMVLTSEALSRCFTKNYATASSISRTSDSLGMVVFAPLIQLFLNTYGWRGTMLLVGGLSMHFVACGALMMTTRLPRQTADYKPLPQADQPTPANTNITASCFTACTSVYNNLEFRLLADYRTLSLIVIYCFTFYSQDMWIIYFVSQAQSKGFTLQEAAEFVAIAGAGSLVVKIVQGVIVDRGLVSCWLMLVVGTGLATVSYCATPWLVWYWTMAASSVLILSGSGIVFCLNDVLVKKLFGVDLFASVYGWLGITNAIFRIAFGFIPGLIYDTTDSYDAAFVFLGCVQGIVLIPLLALKYFGHIE